MERPWRFLNGRAIPVFRVDPTSFLHALISSCVLGFFARGFSRKCLHWRGNFWKKFSVRFAGENHLRTQKNTKQSSAQRFLNDPLPKTPFFSCWCKCWGGTETRHRIEASMQTSSTEVLGAPWWETFLSEISSRVSNSYPSNVRIVSEQCRLGGQNILKGPKSALAIWL